MYTIRLLNQDRTLLAVLPVISWSYDRKLSEATGISVKIARSEIAAEISTDELFAFLSPWQPALEEFPTDDCLACATPVLAYYLQLYRNTDAIGMGIIAKRDFSDTTISLKAYTEEHLLSLYRTPADYGIKYDNTDICDLARDMLKGWRTIRYKQNWDEAEDSSQVDITTEPSIVILDKDGAGTYYSSGYITFEFERPDDFDSWERIRWSADNEDPVYSTMAYRTWNGAAWSGWSTEYEGALPDQLGIEIGVTDAVKVQVRITLTSADQESEDDAGDPVGSTPALFAVEIIARTTAFLTSSIPLSSSFEVVGIDADEKTSLQVLRDACEQVGWDFQVSLGALTIAESIGDEREVLFRAGSNMDISQLGDDAAEIINYLIVNGTGSGINRPQITLKDTTSITSYGVRQLVKNFDIEDPDDLETAAQAYLDSVADPFFSWKIKTKFEYDNAPDFFTGDTVTVVDPKSATVQRSRIMQIILSYENDKLDTECYLGKTRANLVPKYTPDYRRASLLPPKSLALAQIEKGLIASIQTPDNSSLWAVTELYASTVTPVTIEAANLIARKRATNFTMEGLLPKTRYYAVARYVDTYGRTTEASVEVSLETLKFSTPFEDMQPADSDPGTLAFQTNGGNVKIYNSGIIDAIDGIYRGSLVVAVVIGLNSFLVNIDPTNGIKSRFGVTGSEETFFHADINGDVSLGNYDGGAGAKWIKSTGKFSVKGDGVWEGDIATGFLETVEGYIFTMTVLQDEATKFAEFNLVNLLAKGSLKSTGNLTHTAPLTLASRTSPAITFMVDSFRGFNLGLTQIGKNGGASSFTAWEVAGYAATEVLIAGALSVTFGGVNIIGPSLSGSGQWRFGIYRGGTTDVTFYEWNSGPATAVWNTIKSLKKNIHFDNYVLGDSGYIGWWRYLSSSDFATGGGFYSMTTAGGEDWHGLGMWKNSMQALAPYSPIFLGDAGKVCVVTAGSGSTLTYSVKTVSTKSWRFGAFHEEYEFCVIIATDGTVAVSDDEFDTSDVYAGPFSAIQDIYYEGDTQRIYVIDDDTLYYTEDCYNWIEVSSTTGIADQKKLSSVDFGDTYEELYIVDFGSDYYSAPQASENVAITAMKRSTVNGSLRIDVSDDASSYVYDDEDAIFLRDVTKTPFNALSAEIDDKLNLLKDLLVASGKEIEYL